MRARPRASRHTLAQREPTLPTCLRPLAPLCASLVALAACGQPNPASTGDADAALDAGADAALDAAPPTPDAAGDAGPCPEGLLDAAPALLINELSANNEGNWIDEFGETDDWIELVNAGDAPVELSDYRIADSQSFLVPLPTATLEPGQRVLLWADDTPTQGARHLPFRISSTFDTLELRRGDCAIADRATIAELAENETLARFPDAQGELARCRYASAGAPNGERCQPPPRAVLSDRQYAPYAWPERFAAPAGPLAISELGLRPASFVELHNVSDETLALADFALELSPQAPGVPFPALGEGTGLPLDAAQTLAPGERAVVNVREQDVAALAADPVFEGVVTLFADATGEVIDRIDFMRWPSGATLARGPDAQEPFRFCTAATPGADNAACDPLAERDVGDRVRHLRTPGDFSALAQGAALLGTEAVKFVVDMQAGDVTHLLSSRAYALHYTFVREAIDKEPPLDRCDPQQNSEFYAGWSAFSQREYFRVEGRRYLLGTLEHHGAADLETLEFTTGDVIAADQIEYAFFALARDLPDWTRWAYRPQGARQVDLAAELEGRLPIIGENAPFRDVHYQPLMQTVGYGVLEFVPADELDDHALGARTIVVTDDVPNDIPLVGGLITEAFQTPLAHVNVLSQNRDTPNMALRDARNDPKIAEHLGQLVRLEVSGADFSIELADADEAEAFFDARTPSGPAPVPRLDLDVRALQPLASLGQDALPAIGAKAAQLAELHHVSPTCVDRPLTLPQDAFAIPVVHSLEHLEASGGAALLSELLDDATLRFDPTRRRQQLARIREAIAAHPVDPELLASITAAVHERFGEDRVRFRSSSNTEDLPGFNGAGLYTSFSAAIGDPERPIEGALRGVWASLWNERAFDERELARIDHDAVAMGVLVHRAFLSERGNGVAVSRNLLDPTRGDMVYINAQAGEASVTNPAPGVQTEELLYRWPPRTPEVSYLGVSSLTGGAPILRIEDVRNVACAVDAIHQHFAPLLDPAGDNRFFAMQIEWKLIGDAHTLVVKQGRPHPFHAPDIPADCREF